MNLAITPRASRLALAPLVFLVGACGDSSQATVDGGADYVLRGGVVMTAALDAEPASALAVSGDRVLAVGSDEEVARHIGSDTRVIELDGRLVTPGFNDAHLHFASGGLSLRTGPRRAKPPGLPQQGRRTHRVGQLHCLA
jgi:hypothetical protein